MRQLLLLPALIALIALPVAGIAQNAPLAPADAIAATQGDWSGELQYRDYQSNSWQGLPMTVSVMAQPDGVTTVRSAQFDDGPVTGIVTITTVAQVDIATATLSYAQFRKGRAVDSGNQRIVSFVAAADPAHWTMVTFETRTDGDSVADVRETTTRAGAEMTTLKEVNPHGDGVDEWLPRNRTVLTRDDPAT